MSGIGGHGERSRVGKKEGRTVVVWSALLEVPVVVCLAAVGGVCVSLSVIAIEVVRVVVVIAMCLGHLDRMVEGVVGI